MNQKKLDYILDLTNLDDFIINNSSLKLNENTVSSRLLRVIYLYLLKRF